MLRIHTRNLGNVTVYCLEGRIVNGETAALRNAISSQSQVGAIVLDLGRVSTIDASGLGLLLELRRQAQSRGVRFRLMNVSRFVRQIFEITQLNSVFEFVPRTETLPAIARGRSASMMFASCA